MAHFSKKETFAVVYCAVAIANKGLGVTLETIAKP
jgi:hypothetical protein